MSVYLSEFREYIGSVARLYNAASSFLSFYEQLVSEANEKRVDELPDNLRKMVLGGLRSDGEYSPNAYGKFAEEFFGIRLEDPKRYVAELRFTDKPNTRVLVQRPEFIEFVKLVKNVSKFILDRAGEKGITVEKAGRTDVTSPRELVLEVLDSAPKVSVGVNNFATLVCTIRKTTPSYMKITHSNVPMELLNTLGFAKLLEIGDYSVWGFSDYFTKWTLLYEPAPYVRTVLYGDIPYYYYIIVNGVPVLGRHLPDPIKQHMDKIVVPKTLGGAICMLNEIVWKMLRRLKPLASKWFKNYVSVEDIYVRKAWDSLEETGWSLPDYVKDKYLPSRELEYGYISVYRSNNFAISLVCEEGVVTGYREWYYRKRDFEIIKMKKYVTFPEFFNDMLPAIYLGVVDVALYRDNWIELLVVVREKQNE